MLWLKALHVIAVISWMAGLLYLPRLFVYHAAATPGSGLSETLKVMENRLLRYIMNPAMIVVWITGPWLAWWRASTWTAGCSPSSPWSCCCRATTTRWQRWRKDFAADRNIQPQRFYRIANEVPTVLMIGIVILVIVKPF